MALGAPWQAHAIAHELKLPGVKEWKSWCKGGTRPINVPSNPDKTYKNDGWEGWGQYPVASPWPECVTWIRVWRLYATASKSQYLLAYAGREFPLHYPMWQWLNSCIGTGPVTLVMCTAMERRPLARHGQRGRQQTAVPPL